MRGKRLVSVLAAVLVVACGGSNGGSGPAQLGAL